MKKWLKYALVFIALTFPTIVMTFFERELFGLFLHHYLLVGGVFVFIGYLIVRSTFAKMYRAVWLGGIWVAPTVMIKDSEWDISGYLMSHNLPALIVLCLVEAIYGLFVLYVTTRD